MHMPVSPNEVSGYLQKAAYPATREELLMTAEKDGARSDVLEILGSVGDREYADPADVMSELGNVPL